MKARLVAFLLFINPLVVIGSQEVENKTCPGASLIIQVAAIDSKTSVENNNKVANRFLKENIRIEGNGLSYSKALSAKPVGKNRYKLIPNEAGQAILRSMTAKAGLGSPIPGLGAAEVSCKCEGSGSCKWASHGGDQRLYCTGDSCCEMTVKPAKLSSSAEIGV